MSDQSMQQVLSALTLQELRQRMLNLLEAGKKVIEELNNEELETVTGGFELANNIHLR
jgi:bacteriocin-like protein